MDASGSILVFEPDFSYGQGDWVTDLYGLNQLANREVEKKYGASAESLRCLLVRGQYPMN